jgi:uncharacterized coiled-coil DUF342 family protein
LLRLEEANKKIEECRKSITTGTKIIDECKTNIAEANQKTEEVVKEGINGLKSELSEILKKINERTDSPAIAFQSKIDQMVIDVTEKIEENKKDTTDLVEHPY